MKKGLSWYSQQPQSKKRKMLLISGCAVLLIGAIAVSLMNSRKSEPILRQREYTVTRGAITVGVEGSGKIETTRLPLSFPENLTFERYWVQPGDEVQEGQPLAEISKEALETLIRERQTAYNNAKAALQSAENAKTAFTLEAEKNARQITEASKAAFEERMKPILNQIEQLEKRLKELEAAAAEAAKLQSEIQAAQQEYETAQSAWQHAAETLTTYSGSDEQERAQLKLDEEKAKAEMERLTALLSQLKNRQAQASEILNSEETIESLQLQLKTAMQERDSLNDARAAEIQRENENAALQNQLNQLQLENLQAAIDKAKGELERAKEELKTAQDLSQSVILYAPQNGIVITTGYSKGEKTVPEKPVIELGDRDQICLTLEVEAAEINEVQTGQEVSILVDVFPDQPVKGRVVFRKLVAAEGKYTVVVELDRGDLEIQEGMTAGATIIAKEKSDILILSNKAIFLKDGKQKVKLKSEDSTISEVEIVTGFSDGQVSEIVSGLSENDVVIVEN